MTVPPIFSIIGLLGGALADRLGRRPIMRLAPRADGHVCAVRAVAFALDRLCRFYRHRIRGAIYRPASSAMVADLVPVEERRQVFATFMTANNLGAVLGPALGAIFFSSIGRSFCGLVPSSC